MLKSVVLVLGVFLAAAQRPVEEVISVREITDSTTDGSQERPSGDAISAATTDGSQERPSGDAISAETDQGTNQRPEPIASIASASSTDGRPSIAQCYFDVIGTPCKPGETYKAKKNKAKRTKKRPKKLKKKRRPLERPSGVEAVDEELSARQLRNRLSSVEDPVDEDRLSVGRRLLFGAMGQTEHMGGGEQQGGIFNTLLGLSRRPSYACICD